ncbi:MAG: sigma-54-dependent Fis family transcriptional regulator [Gemmatimonadaceae bacterium]|nr:sigma-54-dependent Fis family transcriptional regulator [Gemmatimonadaceae bacterium]
MLHHTPSSLPAPGRVGQVPYGTQTSDDPVFVGRSPAIEALQRQIAQFAPHDALPILIEGETGTGKSFVARALHRQSPRRRGLFQQVMMSALDDALASSELFGHVAGAFTDARNGRPGQFVSAAHGTLFLDEIGKATSKVQQKLLHAVEHREVWPVGSDRPVRTDVRLVVATNVPLEELVRRGEFLPDLAARLGNFVIRVPSLRERREDIPQLAQQFVATHAPRFGYGPVVPRLSATLLDALQRAEWPYNVRQLDGAIQRILVNADGDTTLRPEYNPPTGCTSGTPAATDQSRSERVQSLVGSMNKTEAARVMGISRSTVYRDLKKG